MPRTERIKLISSSPGTHRFVNVYRWGREGSGPKIYIQASIHADEVPGMLVTNHLAKMLAAAESRLEIHGEVIVVPFANPIGLSQSVLGKHVGRFCVETGTNFNRAWFDGTASVAENIEGKLTDSSSHNVALIREELLRAIEATPAHTEDECLKKVLGGIAAVCDIVLDLHCDCDAVLHMYTHDRLWPKLMDLSEELGSRCQILDSNSGGQCFDESCCNLWANLADKFPGFPIPMACEACTVELRGEADVYDDIAIGDASAIYRFLQRRNIVQSSSHSPPSTYVSPPAPILSSSMPGAGPLSGVDMIRAPKAGVVAWRVRPGDEVVEGQVLGEIVDVEYIDEERVPLVSRTSGLVFGMRTHKLVRPGDIIIKVAGSTPLPWRKGKLLTAR